MATGYRVRVQREGKREGWWEQRWDIEGVDRGNKAKKK